MVRFKGRVLDGSSFSPSVWISSSSLLLEFGLLRLHCLYLSAVCISRELTQTSNVADDMILVQMGTIPKGLSPEQHDIFVVGLRKIIQEIRGRKVKDFKTVASEIAAYRARFLGDSSKILPL